MPSHQERVRRNYACADCDGSGKDTDGGGGEWPCAECDGSGIVLVPKPPAPPRTLNAAESLAFDRAITALSKSCNIASILHRSYNH